MGENIAPFGTQNDQIKMYLFKSRKVWWKPWTWWLAPGYVEIPGVTNVSLTYDPLSYAGVLVKQNPELYEVWPPKDFTVDIEWREIDE